MIWSSVFAVSVLFSTSVCLDGIKLGLGSRRVATFRERAAYLL